MIRHPSLASTFFYLIWWQRINWSKKWGPTQAEKSILWTDAGVDQNFQRDLRAIGPYEFQGLSYGPMAPFALFSGTFIWTNGTENPSKVPPQTGIGPWMAPSSQAPPNDKSLRKEFAENYLRDSEEIFWPKNSQERRMRFQEQRAEKHSSCKKTKRVSVSK